MNEAAEQSVSVGDTVTIPKGYGGYDTTFYPLGGSFWRASEDIKITVTRSFPLCKGCDIEGTTADGRKIALSASNTK